MGEKEKSNKFSGDGKHFGKIWKKWWFWVVIVLALIGGIIEFIEPETEESTAAIAESITEPMVTEEPTTKKNGQTEEPTTTAEPTTELQGHIYDDAIIKDVMNGFRSEKIGEYSIIEIKSDQVTEEILADWYFNYVVKNNFNWCMMLYTDRENEGVYAITGIINKDVKFNIDEYGDYSLGDSANGITYIPDSESTLKEIQ